MTSLQANLQDSAFRGEAPIDGGVDLNLGGLNVQGNWPRMIKLEKEVETRLSSWLWAELDAFYLERQDLLEDWRRFQTLYWATPATKEKNFPFRRAANIVIPLAAIAVEAHFARFMTTLFSVEPFWSIRAKVPEWIETAKPMERYLQSEVESNEALKVFEFCSDVIPELLKLGTAVGKSGYEKLTKKSLRSTGVGDSEEEVFATIKNGATLERVPLGNFIQRLAELDPQTTPMVGEQHEFTWGQLKRMAQSTRMDADAIEKIKHWWQEKDTTSSSYEGDSVQSEIDKNAKTAPTWFTVFKVQELWVSFDVDGSGWDKEIVLDYHRDSRTFLSIRYNWYDDLQCQDGS